MEKVMSVEEKIRRAEEIYNRRNGNNYIYTNKEKKRPSLVHRMIKQIIICFIIYGIFYVVTNREYILSEKFQSKVQEVVSKNEILNNAYNYLFPYIEKYIKKDESNSEVTDQEMKFKNTEENKGGEQEQISEEKNQELKSNDENIGGAEEVQSNEKTQEEKDVEDIKNKISFINPIEGVISSTFGWRTPTTSTVPRYHTGLDIAASIGTKIKSATEGTIILASSEGDYGKHYKIQINDIIIIYAHCNKLYLKEGEVVHQGQEIAEVGSTGNSTGPHLHFEIRKEERVIDPQLILDI